MSLHKPQYSEFTQHQKNTTEDPKSINHPRWCGDPECIACQNEANAYRLDKNKLIVNPHCKVCGGHGFIHVVDDYGNVNYQAPVVPCPAKGCLKESYDEVLSSTQSFSNFEKRKGTEDCLKNALAFSKMKTEFKMLIMIGNYGCGKTHLSNAVRNQFLMSGKDALFYDASDLFNFLKAGIDAQNEEDRLWQLKGSYLLIIDDINTESITAWMLDKFEQIIKYRFELMMPTILTSNNTLEQFRNKFPRLDDRFGDPNKCKICINLAGSYRTGR